MSKETKSYVNQILVLTVPIIIENILQTLLGTVDTYFAGQLNDDSIAAIGVTSLIMNMILAFYMAVSVGVTSTVSRSVGEKDVDKANEIVRQSILVSLFLGLILGVIAYIFRYQILSISGAEDQILRTAIPYYQVVAVPSVLVCLTLVLSASLRASKDTVTPMLATGISNVINIILNFVFMKMGYGVVGLAFATTISRGITVLILFVRLLTRKDGIHLHLNKFRINRKMCCSILKIGIPAGVEKFMMRFGQLVYNGIIISMGTSYYVAHQVGGTIEAYSYIPAFGFSAAAATLVGISMGEKNTIKAEKIVKITYILSIMVMIPIGVIFFLGAPALAAMFTQTKEVQAIVVVVLRIVAFFQPAIALAQVFAGALQGAGDTKTPMYSTFIGTWIIHIGLGYVLGVIFGWKLTGIWIAYVLNNLIRGIFLLFTFKKGKWKQIMI
ncbi:MAG: MATE family efflux transporter [Lachnospiraceae bacterium]|nr:MATE family efflux transporter [Lachnospiraceae bacterium]